MTEQTIIAICGKDGAGKSTLAANLAVQYGNCAIMAFATELRERCISDGFLTREDAYRKPTKSSTRRILRQKSQAYKDRYGHYVWADSLVYNIPDHFNTVIVHDMRYNRELETLKNTCQKVVSIFVGDDHISDDQSKMPSFADLPDLYQSADFLLQKYPMDNYKINDIVKTIANLDSLLL